MKSRIFGILAGIALAAFLYWFTDQLGTLAGPMRACMLASAVGGVIGYLLCSVSVRAERQREIASSKEREDSYKSIVMEMSMIERNNKRMLIEMNDLDRRFQLLHGDNNRQFNRIVELETEMDCKHFTPDEANGSWLLCGHLEDTGLHEHLEELGRSYRVSKRAMKLIKSFAGGSCLGTESVKCLICLSRAFLEQERATAEIEAKGGD